MDNSAWRPDDKEWLEQRKLEWRQIQKHLKLWKGHFKGEYLRHHKELYFYGRIDSDVEKNSGDDCFAWALPLFIWWYHPEPSKGVFQTIFDEQTEASVLATARKFLFESFPAANSFDTDYGMFGGREELMVKLLVPSIDLTEKKVFISKRVNRYTGEEVSRTTEFPLCLPLVLIARYCLNGIMPHVLGYKKNPFSPGQYLWEHLCALIPEIDDERSLERLNQLINIVLTYKTNPEFPKDNPTALRLAERLKEGYDNRDFSEAMLALWDEENTKLGDV